MIFKAAAISFIVYVSNSENNKQYVATFSKENSGIEGTVVVNDGEIIVNLDLSNNPTLPVGYDECTAGGLKWHIHTEWKHNDNKDESKAMCGPEYTSGHYDVWNACGKASSSSYCDKSDDESNSNTASCIPKGDYSPNFAADPFSAEVGDWSGKYGLLELDNDKKVSATFSSFYEVKSAEVDGLSIVFHCNGGARAFCAPFLKSATDVIATDIVQSVDDKTVFADFGAALKTDSKVTLSSNGDVIVNLDASKVCGYGFGCPSLSYGIFEAQAGSDPLTESSRDCANAVGAAYDPTNSCVDFSGSQYCTNGKLCDDSSYSYNCNFAADRYSCAPGDLSGKFGMLSVQKKYRLRVKYEADDSLIPPTDDLVGKVMAIYCPSAHSSRPKILACAPIEEPNKQYVATFSKDNSGIDGTVVVNDGQIFVDLDLSSEPALPDGFDTCTAGGLMWHIHTKWAHDNQLDQSKAMCGPGYTSGHFDVWNACGKASSSSYCDKSDDASNSNTASCIPKGDYSPNFMNDPFSAEVGDWSGKYGKLKLDKSKKIIGTFSSFYEVMSEEVAGLSIVFHCSGGARAFCAPFLKSSTDVIGTDLVQSAEGKTVIAHFGHALKSDSKIILFPNGDITVDLDAANICGQYDFGCTSWSYGIFEAGRGQLNKASMDCANAVGDGYDPTNSCVDFSGSQYCTSGVLCNKNKDSAYEYNCDFAADRYSCAPGDISGKLGMLSEQNNYRLRVKYEADDSLIPPTDDLVGKVMAIYCPSAQSSRPKILACARIEEAKNLPPVPPSGNYTATMCIAVFMIIVCLFRR